MWLTVIFVSYSTSLFFKKWKDAHVQQEYTSLYPHDAIVAMHIIISRKDIS